MTMFAISAALAVSGAIEHAIVIFTCLALSRAVFGLIGSGTVPSAQAYVADRTTEAERTEEIASVTSGFSVGTVVGPAFAAALVAGFTYLSPRYGLLSPVIATVLLAGIVSLLLLTRLPEQQAPQADATHIEQPGARGLWRQWHVAPYLIYAVCLSLVTGVLTQTFLFAVMDKMEVTGALAVQYTGPAFTLGAIGVLLSQLVLIPRLKYSNRTLMVAGSIPIILGTLMIIPSGKDAYAILVFAQFLIGLGQGLVRPGFSAGASLAVPADLQGNVAGLVISANGLGYVVTPFFGLFLYEYVDPNLPFLLCAGLLSGMAIFAYIALKPDQPGDTTLEDI
jgi:MFS family permease